MATIAFALGAGAAAPASAADETAEAGGLSISGSIRARYEAIDGQLRAGFNESDDLFNLRTTLLVEYETGPVRFGAEIYDSRAYLADAGTPLTTNEVNAAELVQAYAVVDFGEAFGDDSRLSAQAGRFLLNLGSRRLVAADDYRNTTNAYTGLRLDARAEGVSGTLIYVLPQIRSPDDFSSLLDNRFEFDRESFDLQLYGGVATIDVADKVGALEISAYRLIERDRPDLATRDRRLMTAGLRFFRDPKPGRADFDFEAFGQFGQVSASSAALAPTADVSAMFAHAEAGYQWKSGWKPRLAAEFDYASGDRPGGDFGRFDTLFGMRRAELGPAGLYNAVGRANLLAPGVRIEVAPNRRTDTFLGYKGLFLASASDGFSTTGVRDPAGASGRFAGHQIEARLRAWIVPEHLRFEASFVNVFHGPFLKNAPNGPSEGETQYISVNLTASF